jgi:hypothetical protein
MDPLHLEPGGAGLGVRDTVVRIRDEDRLRLARALPAPADRYVGSEVGGRIAAPDEVIRNQVPG